MITSKGLTPAKKAKVAQQAAVAEVADAEPAKPLKTYLSRKELTHYRNLLVLKRKEIIGDLDAMEEAALTSGGNLSHMPIHMADIGTDTYDQDFMLGLAESERQRLREIDEALGRIQNKTYGICQMTGNEIPKARLDAKPWAKYTIEAARELEGRMGG
jgi:RNA polymerase-binding protein DksA